MTEFKIPDSAAIMLLPDAKYRAARPKTKDHHLTIAFYGAASQMGVNAKSRLRGIVDVVANRFGPINAKANGIGVFDAGLSGYAVVDLIDGIGPLNVRALVTQFDGLDGATIDTRHGFNPHMTREYLAREDEIYAEITPDLIDNVEFTFDAVGLWFGAERYEVTL